MKSWDVIVLGAGAAGLMCAAEAAKRGRRVLLLDHAKRIGGKILMSGGGRCNFTNYHIEPSAYLCQNPHFVKSALARYTQWDFIGMVEKHAIPYHEKTLGQLFCDESAQDIIDMLLEECKDAGVTISSRAQIGQIERLGGNDDTSEAEGFSVATASDTYTCQSLVVATGGLSMPKLGATPFGYQLAEQFGLKVLPTRAGLVPFTLQPVDKATLEPLAGVSLPVVATSEDGTRFSENLLFTHRGLSGPAVLQISSYWQAGEQVLFELLPVGKLAQGIKDHPNQELKTWLGHQLPKRLVEALFLREEWASTHITNKPLKQYVPKEIAAIEQLLSAWAIKPGGSEGYRTAEVTLGGVDTNELSSKTMMAKKVPNLYFIGEVVDVTGWLGGYNFQWAWSAGWCAGQAV
ncbi:aminoacetone oxidase family FAD-binding enzyme [Oceanisphaera profunda]|uniref:Aminoacetone oxidase family FAD-binding enzyme n=1 Tax=Oceanisphaera profunda TaxID=1416627 RepID=A0A1Y0D506_9GAMM|nr:NAD(P)/FAD-dependent oxidoreductase [Oceanisphaera profunda]ART82610.1 aminoacetone oxidase family FAD-binding enzyme [Oceanisphaera profunda]